MVLVATLQCNRKMDTESFIATYVALAHATTQYTATPHIKETVHDSILVANGYTRDTFEQLAETYIQKPEKWQQIWKSIEQKLKTPISTLKNTPQR